jgi:hypothetical protein
MSLYDIVQFVFYGLLVLAGLGMFSVGAYGSIRLRLLHVERAFTIKQRLQLTGFGLLLLVVALTQIAGVAGAA